MLDHQGTPTCLDFLMEGFSFSLFFLTEKVWGNRGFPGGLLVQNPHGNAGYEVSIPGLGRLLGGENVNPLQYSYWNNPMDRGAWWAI